MFSAPGQNPQTWPLNESHFSCEQPLTLTYILRDMWGTPAMVGSDYPATHSTSGIMQGEDQEMPTRAGFLSASHTLTTSQQADATGSTCADASGSWEPCSTAGAVHVGGIPNNFQNSGGSGCANTYGCPLVDSVTQGNLPLSVFNQSLARILYEEQRFGMLGCDQTPVAASCTNPGGVGAERDGLAPLPTGPSSGATPTADLGTKSGDAAVSEKESEEGAVLLKNDSSALPITQSDLTGVCSLPDQAPSTPSPIPPARPRSASWTGTRSTRYSSFRPSAATRARSATSRRTPLPVSPCQAPPRGRPGVRAAAAAAEGRRNVRVQMITHRNGSESCRLFASPD